MSPPDLRALLGELRHLTDRYRTGTRDSFQAVRQLASTLLHLAVVPPNAHLRFTQSKTKTDELILGDAEGPTDPLPLNDGRFLRISASLYLDETERGPRLKVRTSSFQYQVESTDKASSGSSGTTTSETLPSHNPQIRGQLLEDCLPKRKPLHRVHFPTMRVSIEAVIRLLIDEFGVECNEGREIWAPALEQAERDFLEITHLTAGG